MAFTIWQACQTRLRSASGLLLFTLLSACGSGSNDNPPQELPTVFIEDASITEGDTDSQTLVFNLQLTEASESDVSVEWITSDGTATAAQDYEAASGSSTITAGAISAQISVSITSDGVREPDETFNVELSNPTNATISDGSAIGTITNDDLLPTISIENASLEEGNGGTSAIIFDLELSESSLSNISVEFATSDGSATSGSDYEATSGTIDIAAGATSATVWVTVFGDTAPESDETFSVALSNPSNVLIANGSAVGTINNDDVLPTISIENASLEEGNNGTSAIIFDLELSESSLSNISVEFATSDGTAMAGSDYEAASGTIDIAAGLTSETLSVTVFGDTTSESDETFNVVLSNPSNATIANELAVGTITNDDAVPVSGLESRPDNQTCVAPERPSLATGIDTVEAFANLPAFGQPTKMILEPAPNPRWFVLQKGGELIVFDPDNADSTALYLDLSDEVRTNIEGGLLGMAFHPDYPNTPEIFLSYTIDHSNPSMRTVISRFILDDITTPGSGTIEQVILLVDQDFDNHNGGDIAFGPDDGFLYIGLGDGGDGGDPNDRAQDTTNLLGSFLRIDVTGDEVSFPTAPYAIPDDNPFADQPLCGPGANANDCPEIYAWGFRNPWRWSFDAPTGNLWAGDVGQSEYEEVDIVELGNNYGWRCREGSNNYNTTDCDGNYIDPVAEYDHSEGYSITGGVVYRGSAIPGLIGSYVFADYGSGRIWSLTENAEGDYTRALLQDTSRGPTSFGVDQAGELYFTDINSGRLIKIVADDSDSTNTIPDLLSESGCVDPDDITTAYAGLLPYDINARFWSDGADKERYIGLPNGTTITINSDEDWDFPEGTVIVKNFRLDDTLIETRHLMHHPDGVWAGYSYEWNDDQTEATRVVGGKTVNIMGQDWLFPSEAQCEQCHTSAAGFALGPETAQMNLDFMYPQTGITHNQLDTIDHVMMFSSPLVGTPETLPMLANPLDTSADLDDRARAYLHSNCSQCHRPEGPTPVDIDLRYTTSLADTFACDIEPQTGDLGLANARIINPGNAASSVLSERMNVRDADAMPPVGSSLIDSMGVALIQDWINSLTSCN